MGRGKIFSFAETKYEWNMKEISVSELQDNMFDAIGKEWMLVTAGTQEKFNMMTASWGGTGDRKSTRLNPMPPAPCTVAPNQAGIWIK